jgi:hypothetical protein
MPREILGLGVLFFRRISAPKVARSSQLERKNLLKKSSISRFLERSITLKGRCRCCSAFITLSSLLLQRFEHAREKRDARFANFGFCPFATLQSLVWDPPSHGNPSHHSCGCAASWRAADLPTTSRSYNLLYCPLEKPNRSLRLGWLFPATRPSRLFLLSGPILRLYNKLTGRDIPETNRSYNESHCPLVKSNHSIRWRWLLRLSPMNWPRTSSWSPLGPTETLFLALRLRNELAGGRPHE